MLDVESVDVGRKKVAKFGGGGSMGSIVLNLHVRETEVLPPQQLYQQTNLNFTAETTSSQRLETQRNTLTTAADAMAVEAVPTLSDLSCFGFHSVRLCGAQYSFVALPHKGTVNVWDRCIRVLLGCQCSTSSIHKLYNYSHLTATTGV